MKILELIRLEETDQGTLGVLKIDKRIFCFTLEPSDRLNKPDVSCIPAQQYTVRPYSSTRYSDHFQVLNVPGRTKILFHAGNTTGDTQGCILLGSSVGKLTGHRAVFNSGNTFNKFRDLIGREEHHLTIREVY